MSKNIFETRVTSGKLKNSVLRFKNQEVRPTLSRVRKTLFDWLSNDLSDMDCLDAFAGSGSLGIEAISRNARHITFVEKNKQVAETLKKNITQLKIPNAAVHLGSIEEFLLKSRSNFDLIFLDPPFESFEFPKTWRCLLEKIHGRLRKNGLIYVESPRFLSLDMLTSLDLRIFRQKKFLNLSVMLLEYSN